MFTKKAKLIAAAALLFLSSCGTQPSTVVAHDYEPETGTGGYEPAAVSYEPAPAETENITGIIIDSIPEETAAPEVREQFISLFSGKDVSDIIFDENKHTTGGIYDYEYQLSDSGITILGSNLIYVGESFGYDFLFYGDHVPSYALRIDGDCASVDGTGTVTANSAGICRLVVTDKIGDAYAEMTIHCIENASQVDFIPMVNNIPIANKTFPLPRDFEPGISDEAAEAEEKLIEAAKADGIVLYEVSGFRSYTYQETVYQHWRDLYGSEADLVSARPGFSEHQLGLAMDLNMTKYEFADTKEGKWLNEHCAEYGFILRYPSFDSKQYTGYNFEPWHIRYLGTELAEKVTASGKTLEELLGIDSRYR